MRCSIIIPTLNEALQIASAIASARALEPAEIIVVDGGSSDDTLAAARGADQVMTAARGRASQQNAGAAASRGDVLLFLHADCRLTPGSLDQIGSALADSRCVGGCFRQRIDASGVRFRWLERGNSLRVKIWGLAYGDQGRYSTVEEAVGAAEKALSPIAVGAGQTLTAPENEKKHDNEQPDKRFLPERGREAERGIEKRDRPADDQYSKERDKQADPGRGCRTVSQTCQG
jgi:glycosyltransferase involved in cell wall biosynthesis